MLQHQPVAFDIGEITGASWRAIWEDPGPLIGGSLVLALLCSAASTVPVVGSLIVAGPLAMGLFLICINKQRSQRVEFADLFTGFQHFLPAFLIMLLVSVFSVLGLFLFIIGAFLIQILYMPVYLIYLDTKEDFWTCMETSRTMVWENFGQWLLLSLALLLLNFIGALLCGLGLIITVPMSMMAIAIAYDQSVSGAGGPPPMPENMDAGYDG